MKNKYKYKTTEKRTAIHEAGHAVMAFFLEIPIREMSIIPYEDDSGITYGKIVNKLPKGFESISYEDRYHKLAEKYIMVLMSGHIAEKIFLKRLKFRSESDDRSIMNLITYIIGYDPKINTAYIKYLELVVKAKLNHFKRKPIIKNLAEILIGRKEIKGNECKKVISDLIQNEIKKR